MIDASPLCEEDGPACEELCDEDPRVCGLELVGAVCCGTNAEASGSKLGAPLPDGPDVSSSDCLNIHRNVIVLSFTGGTPTIVQQESS